MATEHLEQCVKELNAAAKRGRTTEELELGYEAVFELLVEDWEPTGDKEELTWREGYEQCLQDVCDAIAQEWGVQLPEDLLRKAKEKASGQVQQSS